MPAITLIRPGVYQAPQGQLRATPARLHRWLSNYQAMRAQGIEIPVCWGHQKAARPGDKSARAENRYYASRFNAGYLKDLSFGKKAGLRGEVDVPGATVDDRGNLVTEVEVPGVGKVKTAIKEVSLAIGDWRDGQGRLWKDSILHCALTPLPVVHGQGGFQLGTDDAICPDGGQVFTLSSFLYTLDTEDDMADEKEEMEAEGTEDEGAETPPMPAPETPPPVPAEPAPPAHFAEALQVLQDLGLHLPPGTTPENLLERICVAGHAVKKADEAEEEDEVGADEAPGGEYTNTPQPSEEQRPITMSTVTDPLHRKLLADRQTSKRARMLKKIERMAKAQFMPAHKANALREKVNGYELSLTPDGDEIAAPVDLELSIWQEAFDSSPAARKAHAAKGREEPRPSPKEHEDAESIQQRAARVSRAK